MKGVKNTYIEKEDYAIIEIIRLDGEIAECIIDLDDVEKCKKVNFTFKYDKEGHARVKITSASYRNMPIWHYIYKKPDEGMVINYKDQNPLNNRKSNLREVTRSINSTNARARAESKTGIRGVYKRKERPGIAKESWVCEWSDGVKRYSRSFSIEKYGEIEAFQRALSLRELKLKELKI